MNNFKRLNIIAGWVTFLLASIVYFMTMEPSASLWDCAEFIATSYKLEVGHPPGAPLFMMIARFFTMFAPSPDSVSLMVNTMSTLCSALTVAFLFWSITHLAGRMYKNRVEELTTGTVWAIIGAGFVGAMAYAYCDTAWFSASEGEVYAMSSLFTAVVFWAMLKWENVADTPQGNRWIVLIAYLMGLSIGVHLLNLLAIPALVFIYYYKKSPNIRKWQLLRPFAISVAMLGGIMYGMVQGSVMIGAWVDRVFVNGFGLPVNSGLTVYALVLIGGLGYLAWYYQKKGRVLLNMIFLCMTVIMLGYSSYASVVIRSVANPPMNSNAPDDAYSLLSMLNREQYGDRPLFKGQYYSTPAIGVVEKETYYYKDGQYLETTMLTGNEFYEPYCTLFPRMYDYKEASVKEYEKWGNVVGRKVKYQDETLTIPTFGENLRFFFSYQVNFMYWRYFLWNFVGRQSDIQSQGDIANGNWLSGIDFIDELYLGPQTDLPDQMKDNAGRNRYFFLPFILGLLGLFFQLKHDNRNFVVVMWLFFMTGLAIVLYLNQVPLQPRERDYAYVGSFYAFTIWIGFGVLSVYNMLMHKIKIGNAKVAAVVATLVCLVVPTLMLGQNYDDHNRSHRYVARDFGRNYLNTCLPNSILMNYGDNDAFPIWNVQEVEGLRPDVRIMNLSYLGGSWYVDQMRIRSNESDPIPYSLPEAKYQIANDMVPVVDRVGRVVDIKEAINFVISDNQNTKVMYGDTPNDFFPAKRLAIPVNKHNAIESGIVKEQNADLIADTVFLTIKKSTLTRSDLVLLDVLANFDWKRPLFFTGLSSAVELGFTEYIQEDGFLYRFVPIKTPAAGRYNVGRIDTEVMYDNLMNKYSYGNVADPRVNCDHFVQNIFATVHVRILFSRLANQLIAEGQNDRAIEVLDYCQKQIPADKIINTETTLDIAESYFKAGDETKANAVLDVYAKDLKQYILYFKQFRGQKAELVMPDYYQNIYVLYQVMAMQNRYRQTEAVAVSESFFRDNNLEKELEMLFSE